MRNLLLLLLASLAALPGLPARAAPVLVYYSSVVPARERQEALRTELRKLAGPASALEFTVFGRFRDFVDQLDSAAPAVVVAPSFFSKFHPEYSPVLGLKKGESRQFRYQVLSLGGDWNERNLSKGRIGMVDEIGRDRLPSILPEILSTRIERIKSVSKWRISFRFWPSKASISSSSRRTSSRRSARSSRCQSGASWRAGPWIGR